MTDWAFASASQLAEGLRARQVGSRELLELYLSRNDRHDSDIHAVVVRDTDRARAAADAADRALDAGDVRGPLHGVPITVKECFDVEGLPTTWGSPAHAGNIARSTAASVQRLQNAGAIVFGKTNVPLLLADWQSYNTLHGLTSNPWDLGRTCGGSSGGSAAALAAGLTGLELGSDLGGSLRVPAHYCGVYAHKPTWGIVPPAGHWLAPGPRTDVSVCGPMARSAADLELALKVMAGADGADARAWRLELPPCPRSSLRDFRVAVMLNADEAEVDEDVQAAVDGVARFLAAEGAQVSWDARPQIDMAQVARDAALFVRVTTAGKMAQADYDKHRQAALSLDPADHGPAARLSRAVTASHRDWLQAHARRYAMQQAWEQFFGQWDVLICPAAPTVAFPHDHSEPANERVLTVNGRPQPVVDQLFWAGLAGIAHLPSTAAPAARSTAGLPIGVQIIGRQYGDLTCIALARLLETAFRGFEAPPLPTDRRGHS